MVVSSDYDSTHEANHSDCSDVAHTEEISVTGKTPSQSVILHALIPAEVNTTAVCLQLQPNSLCYSKGPGMKQKTDV